MKKQNYSTLTSYLSKTKKNTDLYRLYNPHFSIFCKNSIEDHVFYLNYFSRHMVTERNILTIFAIHKEISWFSFSRIYDEIIKIKEYEYNNNTWHKTTA